MNYKAHEIRLYPSSSQEIFFKKSCGVARFSFNWALNEWKLMCDIGEYPSAYTLIKKLNSIKRTHFSWMLESGKCAPQYSIHNLEKAFKSYFTNKSSYPKFKKKGIKDSFVSIENTKAFKQQNLKLWIPRLGWVKCAENLRFFGKVNRVTIKRVADKWFAVIGVEIIKELPKKSPSISKSQAIVGVDLGIKSMCVVSDGTVFKNPKALRFYIKKLKREQRWMSRKVKGSNNRTKQRMKVARLHYRITCVRLNALHNATSFIVNNFQTIVLENLNVGGMIKNRKLSQAITDASFSEFRRQVEYKAMWQRKEVIIADRFFASSKICSCCGHKKNMLRLSDRVFNCEKCGFKIDRDLNAAKNLAEYGSTLKLSESNACGEGDSLHNIVNSPSMKQEVGLFNNVNY